jgi:hypothetical protein
MTARERAHEAVNAYGRCLFGKKPDNVHGVLCNALTAAILAAQSDTIERCARLVRSTALHVSDDPGDNCVCAPCLAALDLARRIRALPPEDVKP